MIHPHSSLTLSSYLLTDRVLRKRKTGGDTPPPPVDPEIAAVVLPAAEPLFDGQTVGDIANIATWRDPANYSSNVGTISSVEVLVDGAAQDNAWPLSEGAAVTIRVTDSQGTTVDWTIDDGVDYLARLTDNGDGTYSLETNGLAPTDLVVPTLTATVDGIDYTYTGHTIAGLTGGPTFANGYPAISHDGAGADPVAGDTATVDPGYLIHAGTLTGPSRQWRRDGASIAAATSATYLVQAADEGTAITCAVTASDANASRAEATPALSVPEAATPPPPVDPEIAAVVLPAAEPLFDGQTVGDIANIATWRDPANYSSNVGTISSVEVLVDGAAQDNAWPLSEGAAVTIRVTDSQGTTVDWTIDDGVDYLARLTDNGDGTYSLETNGLAPTDLVVPTLTATVDGIDYTYTGHTIAGLTGGPTFANGYPAISHDGAGADPVAGDTATVDPGYLIHAGTLTGPSRQWRRDGASIAAATSATYLVQAADEGTAITCAVTASDANASRTKSTTALNVPSGAAAAPTFVGNDAGESNGGTVQLTYPTVQAGDLGIIVTTTQGNSTAVTPAGYTQLGSAVATGDQSSDTELAVFTRTLDGSETTVDCTTPKRHCDALYVYRADGAGSLSAAIIGTGTGTADPVSISGASLNASAGRVLIAIADGSGSTTNISSIANASLSGIGNAIDAAGLAGPNGTIECADGVHSGGTLSATSAALAAAANWAAMIIEVWEA